MSNTSVYGVSIDSRSRNPDEPDNAYTIQLKRTMDRVKSIQLGSFQFQDSRYGYTQSSALYYSEPITIPPNTTLRLTETTTTQHRRTGITETSSRTVSMNLPPTMNQITSMNDGTLELTTLNNHGAPFGVMFYPQVGLRMRLVGGDFPQDLHAFVTPTFPTDSHSPLVTTNTIQSPYQTSNSQSFTWTTDYLDEITGGVGSPELRMIDTTGTPDNYHSYIHAPKPTLVELFTMLNSAANHLTTRTDLDGTLVSATAATPIVVTTTAPHQLSSGDQVVLQGVTGNPPANGTFFITTLTPTTFQLDLSTGTGAGTGGTWTSPQKLSMGVTFGFDNNKNQMAVYSPTQVVETTNTTVTRRMTLQGTLAQVLGWGDVRLDPMATLDPPTSLVKKVQMQPGLFKRIDVPTMVNNRINPGDFRVPQEERLLHYRLPSGTESLVVIDYGRYSGTQLAQWLTAHLNPLPAQITVTYNTDTRKFTFTHDLELHFSLDFQRDQHVGEKLGFERKVYADAHTFKSEVPAMFGVDSTDVLPANSYTTYNDLESKKYTFFTNTPTKIYTTDGTSAVQTGSLWTPLVDDQQFAHNYQPGDILTAKRPTLSGTQEGTKGITGATNQRPIEITTAAAHGLTTGDNVTLELVEGNVDANGTWSVTVTAATTFELDTSDGKGGDAYVTGTGIWWTNVSLVTAVQRPSAIHDVVVKTVWDATTATPLLTLEPTASVFSTQDTTVNRDPLGTPDPTDGLIIMQHARRNVFMLHLTHPGADPSTFGFPSVAWPPTTGTTLEGGTGVHNIMAHSLYSPSICGIPVSNTYTSPGTWNLGAPDYMLIILKSICASEDIHTHVYRGNSYPILAKMLVDSPFVNVSEELHFTTFSGYAKMNSLEIEFRNPDGTLVQFNGRPHNFTLLFTLKEDPAHLPCV